MLQCSFCEGGLAASDNGLKAYNQCSRCEGGPCHLCRDYIDLEKRIQDAKTMLEDMVAQRRKIFSGINHLHDPITRLLPTEIISLIFHHSLLDNWTSFDELDTKIEDKTLISGPLFLGSVCRAWRQIAWSLPSMWTVIRVAMNPRDDDLDRCDVARDWLVRAGILSLSIRVSFWPQRPKVKIPENLGLVNSVIDVVNQSSSRWSDLEIVGPVWLFAKLCQGIRNAPNLRTLRASSDTCYGHKNLLKDHQFRPTHVELHGVFVHTFNTDWSHVTYVSISSAFWGECVELLRYADRLVHCEMVGVYRTSGTFAVPIQPIVRSSLQTLYVRPNHRPTVYALENHDVILNSLILPSLCTAEIVGPSPESLLALITRSSCSITSLKLCVEDFGETLSLESLLSKIPTLQHLSLKTMEERWMTSIAPLDVYSFMDRLALTSGSNFPDINQSNSNSDTDTNHIMLLPNLQSLELLGFSATVEFWRRLSHIFGPDAVADPRPVQRRPLKNLRVDWDEEYMTEHGHIDKQTTLKFMQVRYEGGINLDFRDASFENDFLDLSIQRHVTLEALEDPESEISLSLRTLDVSQLPFCSIPPLGL